MNELYHSAGPMSGSRLRTECHSAPMALLGISATTKNMWRG